MESLPALLFLLLGCLLPMSLAYAAFGVVSAGHLRDPGSQPAWFGYVLGLLVPNYEDAPPSRLAAGFWLAALGIFNAGVPGAYLAYSIVQARPSPGLVACVFYLCVLAALLRPVWKRVQIERRQQLPH